MRLFAVFVLLSASNILLAQPSSYDSIVELIGERSYKISIYSKKILVRNFYVNNTKLNGLYSSFYENGVLKSQILYEQNKKNGLAVYFNELGEQDSLMQYAFDTLHGIKNIFYKGEILKHFEYKNGMLHGLQFENYRMTQTPMYTIEYNNGQKNGAYITYWRGKIKQSEMNYVNGILQGPCRFYNDDGKLTIVGQYEDNKEVGNWYEMGSDGKIIKTNSYSQEPKQKKKK